MFINSTPTAPSITVDSIPLERVEDFTYYLGSTVSSDNAAGNDITARLGKAQGSFAALRPIWKSKQHSLRTKGTDLQQQCEVSSPVWIRVLESYRVRHEEAECVP